MSCIFCKIASGEIPASKTYEDEDVIAFRDLHPQAPTHILVIPRKHIATINDLENSDAALIGKLFLAAKKIAADHETPEHLIRDYIGGRGMGVAMIADSVGKSFDDPEMPLIFATGPLVGTAAPTSGRMAVVSRSPLTGTVFDCSVGGKFGRELKRAGYDVLQLRGISDRWVALAIDNERIAFDDAADNDR